ncbi:MAG: hypothetical protein KJ041_05030 [Gammaproteobacteria bacterium]|nr:hypothetical protein [Gammaproteobacteria bacterium]
MHDNANGFLRSGLRGFLCAGITALVMASFSTRFLEATNRLADLEVNVTRSCCMTPD